jgi:hypothetical protein
MVPLRNPHLARLWGLFFARLPILPAWVIASGGTLSDDSSSRPAEPQHIAR